MSKVLWTLEVSDLINLPKHRHPIPYDGPQEILLTILLPYIQNSHVFCWCYFASASHISASFVPQTV